jgi:hypothetical protein
MVILIGLEINIMNRKEAIEWLYNNKHGKKEDAINVIGRYLYKQFYAMGFISESPGYTEGEQYSIYSINKSLIDAHDFYREPTEEEKKMGKFCNEIGM